MSAKGKLRILDGGLLSFHCPGCKCNHSFDSRWTFDGNFESPTFSPSLRVGPYWTEPDGWNYDTAPRDSSGELLLAEDGVHVFGAIQVQCHLFVRAGMIEFLADCTHEFAGKTVPMEDEE